MLWLKVGVVIRFQPWFEEALHAILMFLGLTFNGHLFGSWTQYDLEPKGV
jgi:hypothetical protein